MTLSVLSAPTEAQPPATSRPVVQALAVLGTAWNLFGLARLLATLDATPDSLMGGGLTAAQAAAYLALPGWMTLAFAVGVLCGLAGCLALALRRRVASPVLAVSLLAYVALAAGDAHHGLFAAIPQRLPVMVIVLAVAAALLTTAVAARRTGWLR